MHQHAGGHRIRLRGFDRHGQRAFQRKSFRSEADFGFRVIRFFFSDQYGGIIVFLFCRDKLHCHDFPVVFLVFMGEIQFQILLFHAKVKHMSLELEFVLLEAAVTAELDKLSRHPFQIGQEAFVGFQGHIPPNLQVIVPPQTAHFPSADVIGHVLLDRFFRPDRNVVFHLLGLCQCGNRQYAHCQQHHRQSPCDFSSVHRPCLPLSCFIPSPFQRRSFPLPPAPVWKWLHSAAACCGCAFRRE